MCSISSYIFLQLIIQFILSRLPPYLMQSPHLVFETLSQQLNCQLNKKGEQMFIHLRLQLFDRQYRLDVDQHLWQSCLNLGCQEKLWPVGYVFLLNSYDPSSNDSFIHFLASIISNG